MTCGLCTNCFCCCSQWSQTCSVHTLHFCALQSQTTCAGTTFSGTSLIASHARQHLPYINTIIYLDSSLFQQCRPIPFWIRTYCAVITHGSHFIISTGQIQISLEVLLVHILTWLQPADSIHIQILWSWLRLGVDIEWLRLGTDLKWLWLW